LRTTAEPEGERRARVEEPPPSKGRASEAPRERRREESSDRVRPSL
jgi:hypothetical protein